MKDNAQGFELDDILSKIENDSYWVDFIKVRHLEAGVLRLYPGEEDTQCPHDADELYFVVEGTGFVSLGKESRAVKRGSVLFVPAQMPHHFYGNRDTLIVLYIFAE
jgi:mannose-6-phosphate isomerase-like protein (cupin superfamily)